MKRPTVIEAVGAVILLPLLIPWVILCGLFLVVMHGVAYIAETLLPTRLK